MGESPSSPASFNFKTSTPRGQSSAHPQKGKQNMADYFTNFSLIVPLPDEAAVNYALELANQAFHAHMARQSPMTSRRLFAM
jgi:hypothetical protein